MANLFGFIDESGILDAPRSEQPLFAVGLLTIRQAAVMTEELMTQGYNFASIQKQQRNILLGDLATTPRKLTLHDINTLMASTRHREFKFAQITAATLKKYINFVDLALRYPFRFNALVFNRQAMAVERSANTNQWSRYLQFSTALCKHNISAGDQVCVIADYANRPKKSAHYFENILNELPCVYNTLRAHSESFALLQVCDLFLGAVSFLSRQELKMIQISNRSRAKRYFVNHVISKIGMPTKACDTKGLGTMYGWDITPEQKSGGIQKS